MDVKMNIEIHSSAMTDFENSVVDVNRDNRISEAYSINKHYIRAEIRPDAKTKEGMTLYKITASRMFLIFLLGQKFGLTRITNKNAKW